MSRIVPSILLDWNLSLLYKSQVDSHSHLCDKVELCASATIIPVPQLVKETDSFVLERNTCAEIKNCFPLPLEKMN